MRFSKVGNRVASTICGTTYATVTDAATRFGGSTKSLNDWLEKGITQRLPFVEHGARALRTYPSQHLAQAERDLVKDHSCGARVQSGASSGE
jgi:hypothetical protein